MTRARLSFGLHWASATPAPRWSALRDALLTLLLIALLLLAYIVVAINDARAEAEQRAAVTGQMFNDFLHGGTLVAADGHFAARCENLVEATQ